MFREAISKSRGRISILGGKKKAIKTVRKVSVASFHGSSPYSVEAGNTDGNVRFSSTAAAAVSASDIKSDAVQHAIRILNNESGIENTKFVMTERLHDFEKLIIEARQSINDCVEGDEDLLDEDKQTAQDAVREAIDVFDDIRYDFSKTFSEEGSRLDGESNDIIKSFAKKLEQLKEELDSVLGETNKSNVLFGLDNIMNTITKWRT